MPTSFFHIGQFPAPSEKRNSRPSAGTRIHCTGKGRLSKYVKILHKGCLQKAILLDFLEVTVG